VLTLRDDPLDSAGDPAGWLREALGALADHVQRGRLKRLALERFDGEPVVGSPYGVLLIELGFRQSPRKLTLTA
jgi:ATP-dependent Lhr-like helicase